MLLKLTDAARYLNVPKLRMYSLDAELRPELRKRGSKMRTRVYRQEILDEWLATRSLEPELREATQRLKPVKRNRLSQQDTASTLPTKPHAKSHKVYFGNEMSYDAGTRSLWNVLIDGAARRGLLVLLNVDTFVRLATLPCLYCGRAPKPRKISNRYMVSLHGLDRVDNALGYSESNCVPCCSQCNMMKSDFTVTEFLEHVKRISVHSRL